jgi:cytochrome c oxidase accessory protein FixG
MKTEIDYLEIYEEDTEEYRNSIATVDKDGKRVWLYPKKPKGAFFNKRIIVTVVFLIIFFAGPLVKIGGQPLLMFNIFERKFVILGQLFLPQDFVIFGIGMIIFFVFIILFTVVYGRVWCGWFCPQTVFMEMIFRPIENYFEGDGRTQKKFDDAVWDSSKIFKKTAKHLIYIAFSAIIAHVTMAYLVGIEQTISIITSPPTENLAGFIGILAFTVIFYYVFAKLREQVCIAICPYGRLQGVLVNKQTSAVMYDYKRGEPREKLRKTPLPIGVGAGEGAGHCIDCSLCVQVCPTGIDIRNGIQLECTNCTACMDACDDVMVKISRPTGLIRHASQESIESGIPFKLSKRAYAYSAVLVVLMIIEGFLLFNRGETETTILRVPGQMYQENNEIISNLYNAQVVNKTFEPKQIRLQVADNQGVIRLIGKGITVSKGAKAEAVFFVDIPKNKIKKVKTPIKIQVFEGNKLLETVKTNFMGPAQTL